jgi:hypothetical protein
VSSATDRPKGPRLVKCIDGPLHGLKRPRPPLEQGVDEHEELVGPAPRDLARALHTPPSSRVVAYQLRRKRRGTAPAFDVLVFLGYRRPA